MINFGSTSPLPGPCARGSYVHRAAISTQIIVKGAQLIKVAYQKYCNVCRLVKSFLHKK
jgi:hypothetical protein